jgi:cytoskeletal protein CcmA (bactofilin family)
VVISEEGTIEGKVRAPRLLINGELRGDVVDSKLVVLGPRARVHGNIEAEKFAINEGAHFYGHVQMTNRPK